MQILGRIAILAGVPAALALGACSQSLTSGVSGTGGMPATGGVSGTGGAGGADLAATCSDLASAYQAAVVAAQDCAVGQSEQCQQLVPALLSSCGACPTYVNDASKPQAIQQLWIDAGCNHLPAAPCVDDGICIPPPGAFCAVVLDTNRGSCAGAPTITRGSVPDAGLATCNSLIEQYDAALSIAKSCTTGGGVQCTHSVPQGLSRCPARCSTYVNDATQLNALQQAWNDDQCDVLEDILAVGCLADPCPPPIGGMCAETDGGGATCTNTYGTP